MPPLKTYIVTVFVGVDFEIQAYSDDHAKTLIDKYFKTYINYTEKR